MNTCLFCFAPLVRHDRLLEGFKLREQAAFCSDCIERLRLITAQDDLCSRCRKSTSEGAVCGDCFSWEREHGYIVKHDAVFHYNDFALDALWQIKYNRDIHLIRGFYFFIKRTLKETYDLSTTVFIPIPSNQTALEIRRFNLIEFIFFELHIPVNVVPIFVTLTRKEEQQHSLNKAQRLRAADRRYRVDVSRLKVLEMQQYEHIVIIDDVYTSGATIRGAVQSLPSLCRKHVRSFSIFR